jgi:starch-binding outer membrane protein, SusD/RagB family
MKKAALIILFLVTGFGCTNFLDPEPVALLIDDLALNEAKDVPSVEIGLYGAFRGIAAPKVIAGDMTADMLIHIGTFNQYREFSNKQITSTNASAAALWGSIYRTIYVANFILEKLPGVPGVTEAERNEVTATARFLRGYAYFVGVYTFGAMPITTTSDLESNRNVPRSSVEDLLAFIEADYAAASGDALPESPVNAGFVSQSAVVAARARLALYRQNWAEAEALTSQIIDSENYTLVNDYSDIVLSDFTDEAILEVGYTVNDDPGTDANYGLNDLFRGRREIIPSNQTVVALNNDEAGDRFRNISFDLSELGGVDNGWSVAKYGTADEDNNNIIIFRLGEMYLIRAEARAQQNKLFGSGSALEDVNVLRSRANGAPAVANSKEQVLQVIERERLYELAYEGHRWYDLVRTGRAKVVMTAFNTNWQDKFELWPIPLREIQYNPALQGAQNPGY